jgi:hypothetical protein
MFIAVIYKIQAKAELFQKILSFRVIRNPGKPGGCDQIP